MSAKPIAWSYSSLNAFETCARRFQLTRVSKIIDEPQSEQILWGNKVHKALELRLNGEAGLPPELNYIEPLASLFTRQHGTRLVEKRLAVDRNFQPTDYNWKNLQAWCRGVIDVGIVGTETAVLADWKTGNRKPESEQLKLMAGLAFAHYPYLKQVHTAFIWLKDSKLDSEVYTHEQVGAIWSAFLPRVTRLEVAHQKNVWQPKPSGLCGKWCPVTRQYCEFGR